MTATAAPILCPYIPLTNRVTGDLSNQVDYSADDIPLLKCYRNTGFNKHTILLIPFWHQEQFRPLSKHMKHILLFTVVLITKISPCNEYPLTSHFYIVKIRVYRGIHFFLFLLQNIDCGYSLEPSTEAVLTCTHNQCFEQK